LHINPDHVLQTPDGRETSRDANELAWQASYRAFHRALQCRAPNTRLVLLIGAQGAGKSTWAREHIAQHPASIVFDAIIVRRRERLPLLAAAEAAGVPAVAVWFKTTLAMCLARNAGRPADEQVPEQAIRNVHAALEPPHPDEGFEAVIEVADSPEAPG